MLQSFLKSLNDRYSFTDYVEDVVLIALWKMCVKKTTTLSPSGIFKMDEHKPCKVCLYFDPILHSFRDPFLL